MVCPSCTHRETSASFAASAVKTQAKSECPTIPTLGGSDVRFAQSRCPKPSSALPSVAGRGEKKWTATLAPTITDVSGISL